MSCMLSPSHDGGISARLVVLLRSWDSAPRDDTTSILVYQSCVALPVHAQLSGALMKKRFAARRAKKRARLDEVRAAGRTRCAAPPPCSRSVFLKRTRYSGSGVLYSVAVSVVLELLSAVSVASEVLDYAMPVVPEVLDCPPRAPGQRAHRRVGRAARRRPVVGDARGHPGGRPATPYETNYS